ncbi:MAG: hypothetical protein HY548_01955, partial [Elusimicrobia bacterium]|nr:hypothetical protein [Elusimicrobiota bacterium]
ALKDAAGNYLRDSNNNLGFSFIRYANSRDKDGNQSKMLMGVTHKLVNGEFKKDVVGQHTWFDGERSTGQEPTDGEVDQQFKINGDEDFDDFFNDMTELTNRVAAIFGVNGDVKLDPGILASGNEQALNLDLNGDGDKSDDLPDLKGGLNEALMKIVGGLNFSNGVLVSISEQGLGLDLNGDGDLSDTLDTFDETKTGIDFNGDGDAKDEAVAASAIKKTGPNYYLGMDLDGDGKIKNEWKSGVWEALLRMDLNGDGDMTDRMDIVHETRYKEKWRFDIDGDGDDDEINVTAMSELQIAKALGFKLISLDGVCNYASCGTGNVSSANEKSIYIDLDGDGKLGFKTNGYFSEEALNMDLNGDGSISDATEERVTELDERRIGLDLDGDGMIGADTVGEDGIGDAEKKVGIGQVTEKVGMDLDGDGKVTDVTLTGVVEALYRLDFNNDGKIEGAVAQAKEYRYEDKKEKVRSSSVMYRYGNDYVTKFSVTNSGFVKNPNEPNGGHYTYVTTASMRRDFGDLNNELDDVLFGVITGEINISSNPNKPVYVRNLVRIIDNKTTETDDEDNEKKVVKKYTYQRQETGEWKLIMIDDDTVQEGQTDPSGYTLSGSWESISIKYGTTEVAWIERGMDGTQFAAIGLFEDPGHAGNLNNQITGYSRSGGGGGGAAPPTGTTPTGTVSVDGASAVQIVQTRASESVSPVGGVAGSSLYGKVTFDGLLGRLSQLQGQAVDIFGAIRQALRIKTAGVESLETAPEMEATFAGLMKKTGVADPVQLDLTSQGIMQILGLAGRITDARQESQNRIGFTGQSPDGATIEGTIEIDPRKTAEGRQALTAWLSAKRYDNGTGALTRQEMHVTYTYDDKGRLTGAHGSGTSASWDEFGNKTTSQIEQKFIIINGQAKLKESITASQSENIDGTKSWSDGTHGSQATRITYFYDTKTGLLLDGREKAAKSAGLSVTEDAFKTISQTQNDQYFTAIKGQAKMTRSVSASYTEAADGTKTYSGWKTQWGDVLGKATEVTYSYSDIGLLKTG